MGDPAKAAILVGGDTLTTFSLSPDEKSGASTLIPAAELRLWSIGPSNSFSAFGSRKVLAKESTRDDRNLLVLTVLNGVELWHLDRLSSELRKLGVGDHAADRSR